MNIDQKLNEFADESRQFNTAYNAAMAEANLSFATPEDAVRTREALDASVPPLADDRIQPEVVDVGIDQPKVSVRRFRPTGYSAGVVVQFHMGAWVIGSALACDDRSSEIAERCGVDVLSVDYRMVPEHMPPAQLEDALNVIRWVQRGGYGEFSDLPIVLIGESAGCTLAVLALVELRQNDELDRIGGVALAYGLYDVSGGPSQRADEIAMNAFSDAQNLVYPGTDAEARRHPSISPLFADLSGLPSALFSVGTDDALIDDTLFMYERWCAAGNQAKLVVYPDSLHGFDSFPTAMARAARLRIDDFLRVSIQA